MRPIEQRLAKLEAAAGAVVEPARIIRVIIGAKDGKPDGEPKRYLERAPDGSLIEIPEAEANACLR